MFFYFWGQYFGEKNKKQLHLVFTASSSVFFYFDNAVPGIFSLKICFLAHISLTWSFCACVHVIKRKGEKELERLKASTPDWSNPVAAVFHPNL